jgi:hypothetical protein
VAEELGSGHEDGVINRLRDALRDARFIIGYGQREEELDPSKVNVGFFNTDDDLFWRPVEFARRFVGSDERYEYHGGTPFNGVTLYSQYRQNPDEAWLRDTEGHYNDEIYDTDKDGGTLA